MTRLEAEARMQYVPVHPAVVALMATWVAPAPARARMADVCAGEGAAAAQLAAAWGISRDRLYLNELADGRMARCREHSDHVLGADAIRSLQAGRAMFQVAWTNPPFGHQPKEQGGGRLEPLFFKRVVEEGMWLQPGGVHLMLAPLDVWLTNVATLNHLARCYDAVQMWALPATYRAYREVLVMGVVRSVFRLGDELRTRAAELVRLLMDPALPELTAAPAPVYQIPAPDLRAKPIWRDLATATPEQAQTDLLTDGGAWASRTYRRRLAVARADRVRIRPLFPLGKVAAALRIANGDINNAVIELNGAPVRIKGGTRTHVREWEEERVLPSGRTVVDRHRMETSVPVVVTMDVTTGAITRYVGDAGIAALMEQPEATQRLLDAVATSAPPIYAMQMPADVAAVLDRMIPASGRALPGYQPGLIPMQRHIVAALVEAFRQPDPHTRRPRRALGLSAEMGCGKSAMGTATAEALRCLLPTNPPSRAFTALVVAPNHLIGELAQVQAHDGWRPDAAKAGTGDKSGKGRTVKPIERPPLPQWIAEWRDLLPHWHTTVLETPAQVSAFYAAAQADPATPRVGFISFSKFSLGSGWEVAVTERPAMVPVRDGATESERRMMERRLAMYNAAKAQEQREWMALQMRRKAEAKRAQQVVDADGDAKPATRVYGPGVSERTIKRDLLFRCGTAFRDTLPEGKYTPVWHWGDGVYCPDCGRRVLDKAGFPHTRASLKRAGMVACPYCGGILGQLTRSQDNVGDRDLPVFNHPQFRDHHVLESDPRTGAERRAIPWGERPRSNPRMALGDFMVQRGYAALTDLVITDEFHAMKGLTSARGRIWGRLIEHAHRSIGLTGSPYGGKASTAYWLLQRMNNPFVRSEFGWTEESAFVQRYGIVDSITTVAVEEEAQKLSGKRRTSTRIEERNGVTAELAAIMQSQFLFVLLKQMGFRLPAYDEGVVTLTMPPSLATEYQRLATAGKEIIAKGGRDALSAYLQATLTYPLSPWQPVTIASTIVNMEYRAPEWRADTILPHHEWLAEHALAQARHGRRMLVFVEHTQKLDLLEDLRTKIEQLSAEAGMPVKVAVLRSTTVKPGERAAWFAARERDGTNVVLCHPGLVETGLNLIGWPEIVFAEPTYSLYRAMQARKRAYRPTQTRDCKVTWLCYADTMIAQALEIIGSKATAATLLNGDDLSSGLLQIDPGMSILQELAKRVLDDRAEPQRSASELSALFAAAGTALVESLHAGVRDLVGVAPDPVPLALPGTAVASDAPPASGETRVAPSLADTAPAEPMPWRKVPASTLIRRRKAKAPVIHPNLPLPLPLPDHPTPEEPAGGDKEVVQLAFF